MRYVACVCAVLVSAVALVGVARPQGEQKPADEPRELRDVLKIGDHFRIEHPPSGAPASSIDIGISFAGVDREELEEMRETNRRYREAMDEARELETAEKSRQLTAEERERKRELFRTPFIPVHEVVEIGTDFIAYKVSGGDQLGRHYVSYVPLRRIRGIYAWPTEGDAAPDDSGGGRSGRE